MIQLRQLSLTDSLLPFLYLHSPSIRLSSFNFFFFSFLSSNSALVFGALSFPRINIPGAGLGHLHWISVLWCFSLLSFVPFISGRFTTIDSGRLFDLHWVNIFSFLLWSSGLFHDSLYFFSDFLHLISIYEKVVGLCSTTCMYHGRRLSDIHTRFIELFRFHFFFLGFYIISQQVPAVLMCSVWCQCQFIYSNLVWYYMPGFLYYMSFLYYVITCRRIQVLWFITTLIGFSINILRSHPCLTRTKI